MRPFLPGSSLKPLLLHEMQGVFVRLIRTAAVGAGLFSVIIAIASGDDGMWVLAASSAVTAALATLLIAADCENVVLALVPAFLGIVATGAVSQVHDLRLFSSLALVFIGTAAVMLLNGTTPVFLAAYTALLVASPLVWHGWGVSALIDGTIMAGGFLTASIGMQWIRDRSADSASRFLNLFEKAPVSLWEEDFSKVGTWLEGLRATGVTDLRGYLAANRDVLKEGMSLIEVVRVNREAARFLQVDDPSDLVGPLRSETFPDDELPSMVAQFEAIWNGANQVTTEVRHGHTLQGNYLDGLLHWAAPDRLGEPDLSRVIVSVVDVTEMNNTRRSLEQSLKSKDELIATVSHELRTPLTTVVGLSTELSDAYDEFSTEEARDLLQMIADQSMEVATIVEDLLVAARAESGTLKVSNAPVDLHMETKTTLRGLDIEQEVDCHTVGVVPTVYADSGRVRQILRNLLVNAKRYGTPPVRMVVLERGEAVCVEVRDHGEPIAKDEVDKIFDRYYRARQTPGVTASVGLGLTVSRELARLMGGDLTYHHDGESVFTLSLPLPEAPEQAASA
jgi:signal transduction histidine kinase